MNSHAIQLRNFYQLIFSEFDVNSFRDLQSDQYREAFVKYSLLITHAARNAYLNLTLVSGTTNGFIFSNNQFINRILGAGMLDLP